MIAVYQAAVLAVVLRRLAIIVIAICVVLSVVGAWLLRGH